MTNNNNNNKKTILFKNFLLIIFNLYLMVTFAVAADSNSGSNISIYGNVDFGYAMRFDKHKKISNNNENSHTNSRLNGGQADASRIGFRGSESFSNGNRAIFVLEREFLLDTGEEDGWTQSFIGFENEKLGSIFGGQMDTAHYSLLSDLDPFKAGTVGNYANTRKDILDSVFTITALKNSLMYISPKVNNFEISGFYSNNMDNEDNPTNNNANSNFYNLAVNYENENFKVATSYHYIKFADTNNKNLHNFTLGGAYEFDNELKISGFISYDKLKLSNQISNDKNINLTHIMLGAEKPFGRHNVKGSLNYTHNKKTQYGKSWQLAVGYDYNLSKRTNLYAAYSYIKNNNARAAVTNDFQNEGGNYQQAFQFGIKHNF